MKDSCYDNNMNMTFVVIENNKQLTRQKAYHMSHDKKCETKINAIQVNRNFSSYKKLSALLYIQDTPFNIEEIIFSINYTSFLRHHDEKELYIRQK